MNFALILFLLTLVTGILWSVDRFHFRKKRAADAPEPAWVEYAASFFPVLLVVFLLQNDQAVPVSFLGAHGTAPLALLLLIAGLGVAVAALTIGFLRAESRRRRRDGAAWNAAPIPRRVL